MKPSLALQDRVALVTRGDRDIGKSITGRPPAAGVQVVKANRKAENLEATARVFVADAGFTAT